MCACKYVCLFEAVSLAFLCYNWVTVWSLIFLNTDFESMPSLTRMNMDISCPFENSCKCWIFESKYALARVIERLCIYLFVRPKTMCTLYRAPKARELRWLDLYAAGIQIMKKAFALINFKSTIVSIIIILWNKNSILLFWKKHYQNFYFLFASLTSRFAMNIREYQLRPFFYFIAKKNIIVYLIFGQIFIIPIV